MHHPLVGHLSEPFRSMIEENVPRSEWDDDDIQYQGGTFAEAGHFEDE